MRNRLISGPPIFFERFTFPREHRNAARRDRLDRIAALITPHTRLVSLTTPHNPTGGTLTKKDILDVADAIGDR